MRHLIVFDLDGTLVDSRLDLAGSANILLNQLGARPLSVDQVVGLVGEGARVLVGRLLAVARVDADLDTALARFLAIYDQHLVDHTCLYPGIREALEGVQGLASLAVLTNKPGRHTERLLAALDARRFFDAVIGGDGPWPRKPDPASLRHLMTEARASAETTIMVGDSMVDVETARRAPSRVCIARYGFGLVPDAGTAGALVVEDPRHLGALLRTAIQSSDDGVSRS